MNSIFNEARLHFEGVKSIGGLFNTGVLAQ